MTNQPPRIIEAGINAKASPAKVGIGKPAPLVEDTSVVGGVDAQTGASVVRPKTVDGKADSRTEATDPRERR